jgi:hypothetical protein
VCKEAWRKIWIQALENMPYKIRHHRQPIWVAHEKGTVPVAVFVLGRAMNLFKIEDGVVYELKKDAPFKSGRKPLLAKLLGRRLTRDTNMHIGQGLMRGTKPRSKKEQEMLMRLASHDGPDIGWEYVTNFHNNEITRWHKSSVTQ